MARVARGCYKPGGRRAGAGEPGGAPGPSIRGPVTSGGRKGETIDQSKPEETGGGVGDATQWHEVEKSKTLKRIAEHYYHDGSLYSKIFEANRDVLKDPNGVRVGQKLRIP